MLKTCLSSILEKSSYENFEVLVINNRSQEPSTLKYLRGIDSEIVRVVEQDVEFNFSALNNFGAREARGEYLCLMNNDIEVITPDWIDEMLSFATQKDVGCVGARLWYPNNTLQHGGVILGMCGVAEHAHKHLPRGENAYFSRAILHQSYSAVTAACLMVSKTKYLSVGGLNENLQVAYNDIDFCLRLREAGLRNVWTPYAELYHHESATRGYEDSPIKVKRLEEESAYMLARWGAIIKNDPAYSPNLTLTKTDFSLAWPSRVNMNSSLEAH